MDERLLIIKNSLIKYLSNIKGLPLGISMVNLIYKGKEISISILENNIDHCILNWNNEKIKFVLDQLDLHYYNNQSLVSDSCYDKLNDYYYQKTKKKRIKIGAPVTGKKVKLPLHMGSMDKVKPGSSELNSFFKNYINDKCIMDKLDGTSLLLDLRNLKAPKAYTRGDGTYGKDVSYKIGYINGLSHILANNKLDICGFVRGELIISKDNWLKIKDKGANARNYVSGAINRKDINISQLKYITFVAYELCEYPKAILSISEQLDKLKILGFTTVDYTIFKNLQVDKLPEILESFKKKSMYEIDGIIIQDNILHERNTSNNPKYAKAFKMDSMCESAITKIKEIKWSPSRRGVIKPVAIIEPVYLGGVKIEKATAYNAKFVKENGLGKGALIRIIRSGDVIPKIVEVLNKVKPNLPSENVHYFWDSTNTDIILVDKLTSDTVSVKQIEHFINTLDVSFFKIGFIKKTYVKGCKNIYDILNLNKETLINYDIDGIKDKISVKIVDSLHSSLNNCTLGLLAAATPYFDGLGKKRMQIIDNEIPDWLHLDINDLRVKILQLEGFSNKTWLKVNNGLDKFKKFYEYYLSKGFKTKVDTFIIKKQNGKLNDRNFVFTGFRNKILKDKIVNLGGIVSDTLSKKKKITDLIIKDLSVNNNKVQLAKELKIRILTEEDVNKLIM